ncbi:MAG: helix-turn-helix domain-containing protein [Bdellovibrionota bacterium]
MGKDGKQSYYEVLDVSFNANPEIIRTAYIRAKNAYNRDSLAAYSLFDKEDSKRILDEIEEAYTILSDSEKRRKYDESHGIVSSESVYENYHRGNHAVAAFARDALAAEADIGGRFSLEQDPFRKQADTFAPRDGVAPAPTVSPAASASPAMAPQVSPVERLRAMQDLAGQNAVGPRSYQVTRAFEANPEMEERIKNCENVTGSFLRSVREYKRVSAEEIMNILKISKNYLTALEEDDVGRLPANVFVRGFVIQYAKALKLEHEKVANAYMTFLRAKRPG